MRCKNCGWPNRPGEKFCVKCNTPLEAEESSSGGMKATVLEGSTFDGNAEETEERLCPKCGNVLPSNVDHCPNCNYAVVPLYQEPASYSHQPSHPTRMDNPAVDKTKVVGTINPYMIGEAPDPTIILKPQKRLNERKELPALEYEGKSIILNRSNTEAENDSITSQTQAVITNVDGHWFIEDKSELGTTFVRASKKLELSEGDVILLGNRLFEFHISNE